MVRRRPLLTLATGKAITENRVPFHEFQAPIKLPFPQLSTFTGREEILTSMVELLNPLIQEKGRPSRRTVVLHGMGGIGKSQVALEYVYRNKERYSSVYWIDATNSDIINASGRQILETLISHYATRYPRSPEFARIATDLGIPGQIDNAGQLIDGSAAKSPWQVVRRWLAKDGNIGWCLVVDGINDQAVDRIVEILPPSAFGHVIVTSRMMTVTCDHLIDVPVMDKESGIKLLLGSKLENAAPDGIFHISHEILISFGPPLICDFIDREKRRRNYRRNAWIPTPGAFSSISIRRNKGDRFCRISPKIARRS